MDMKHWQWIQPPSLKARGVARPPAKITSLHHICSHVCMSGCPGQAWDSCAHDSDSMCARMTKSSNQYGGGTSHRSNTSAPTIVTFRHCIFVPWISSHLFTPMQSNMFTVRSPPGAHPHNCLCLTRSRGDHIHVLFNSAHIPALYLYTPSCPVRT